MTTGSSGNRISRPLASSASWIRFFDDARVLKFAFYALLFGVIATLFNDYRELAREEAFKQQIMPIRDQPVLPSHTPRTIEQTGDDDPADRERPAVTTDREILNQPMTIELTGDGVLKLAGSITQGTATAFLEKTGQIGEYIKIIDLNSPGGSVYDALEISSAIRENGWNTYVADGNLCASSCPLVFAGGKERKAGENAAIGVHQVFAVGDDTRSNSEAISGTQHTTAQITRHLETMDVDPVLWIHALETPPDKLFYLNREELEKFRLVTK